MKKYIPFLIVMLLSVLLAGCGKGNVSGVKILELRSAIYTDWEIRDAVEVAVRSFENEFHDCRLLEIGYAGDEKGKAFVEWADQYDVDQVIILVSSFEAGPDGGDGSLNPNETYRNWQWILGRKNSGRWKLLTHGYG